MFKVFLAWLRLLKIPEDELQFEMYVHENRKSEVPEFKRWWSIQLQIPTGKLESVYFKRDKINTNRTNTTDLYHGLIRIRVRSSTSLNRQVNGWIQRIVQQ